MNTINKYLAENAISLRELSRRAGISAGHLSQIANGKGGITARSAKRLAKAMGIRAWWTLVTHR